MNRTRALGLLTFALAFACGGTTLTVDGDPGASGGATAGSTTESSGGSDAKGGMSAAGGSSSGSGGGSGASGAGSGASGAGSGGTTTVAPGPLPCDVFEAEGYPCVAAHSTVRVLRRAYDGPLYRVCKGTAPRGPNGCMGESLDIGATESGYGDAAAQEAFCGNSECTIYIVYDQSGRENHLEPAPPGGAKSTWGNPVNADDLPTMIAGHATYGMRFVPGMGYRTGCEGCTRSEGQGIPVDDEPETIYMVTSARDTVNGCCFDYGNAQTSNTNEGEGTAEAVYFGNGVVWGTGSGEGPWVMADLENGLYAGWENGQDRNISTNRPLEHEFVTAILVGDTGDKNQGAGRFALYGGDAQAGELTTQYDGIRPEKPGYVPMRKEGSIVLSIAGDNSDGDGGRFYEGAIVSGAAPKEVLDAVQAALVAARYGSAAP